MPRKVQNSKAKKQEGISPSQLKKAESDTVARIPAGPVSQSCRRTTASRMLPDVFDHGGECLSARLASEGVFRELALEV